MELGRPAPIEQRPLRAVERPEPVAGPGELLLRVGACAVCRTDLQLCEGDLAPRRTPIVPGHQLVGRVVQVGAGVTGWSVGDRAGAGWLAEACGACARCREGRENLCLTACFTGWDRDGGYAELAVVRADFALALPAAFDDVAVAPLLCGGVIGYRSLRISGIAPEQRLGLFGFGASALLALQVALHWRCRVFVATRSPAEQERARELGAEWAGSYDDPIPTALDAAITFAPSGDVVARALGALDRGGTLAINAIHLDRIPELRYEALWWERSIRSVANFTRADARGFLELAATIPITTKTESLPLADANEALARVKSGRVSGAFVLVP